MALLSKDEGGVQWLLKRQPAATTAAYNYTDMEVSRGPLQQLQDVNDLSEKSEEANVGKCSPVLGLSALLNCSYFDNQLLMSEVDE